MGAQSSFNEKGHEHNAKIAWALYAVAAVEVAATPAMEDTNRKHSNAFTDPQVDCSFQK